MKLKILVRSKRDADAVRSTIRIFGIENLEVRALGGFRGGKLAERVLDEIKPFTIVLLGREDAEVAELIKNSLPPFSEIIVSKTKRIRNSVPSQIFSLINRGRASIRLFTSWNKAYILSRFKNSKALNFPNDPQGDTFFIYKNGKEILSELLGREINGVLLSFKLSGGHHEIFMGPALLARIYIGQDIGDLKVEKVFNLEDDKGPEFDNIIETNKPILEVLEKRSEDILRELGNDLDTIIVPWSGGKDSTAALLLSLKIFGRDRVKPVYIDTGVDFLENKEYIEKISSLLKIDYYVYKADVDEKLLMGSPLPTPRYRWCTYRKLLALRRAFKELSKGKTLIVVGDRDAESNARARRPMLRIDDTGLPVAAPLKLWGGAHVEAYILSKGLSLNPLYEMGFYRIGCYICFSLRSWELEIMLKRDLIPEIIERRPEHKEILERFLRSKKISSSLK